MRVLNSVKRSLLNASVCVFYRQKTLGHRTHCSECEMVQGQFCGDCLFMRCVMGNITSNGGFCCWYWLLNVFVFCLMSIGMVNMCSKLSRIRTGNVRFVAGFATAVCAGIIKDGYQLVLSTEGFVVVLFKYFICMHIINELKDLFLSWDWFADS